jgi:signal transduction histidine kinase/predicted CoA-binding protein
MYDFLKKVPMFADLSDEDLERICQGVREVRVKAGQELFSEGSLGEEAYVIQEGQVEILKYTNGRQVLLALRQPGEVIGEISLLEAAPRSASGRARTDCLLLAINHAQLDRLLDTSPTAARQMLHTVSARLRSNQLQQEQSEKMAMLGTLTAGIAHELNNPAAAAQRGAGQLRQAISRLQAAQWQIGSLNLEQPQLIALAELDKHAQERAAQPVELDGLDRSDREAELEGWLDELGAPSAWELAPLLVNLGYETAQLRTLGETFSAEQLPPLIAWLGVSYNVYNLLEEIAQGAGRIAEIVRSLKTYAFLDQAPVGLIDVHQGLDDTLVMLRSKLKGGVTVRREYDPSLPRIQAYGSELNQVWTNLIDNAVDAMDGKGEIVIRTRFRHPWVIVEIEDNGPGIPPQIVDKIFSPFFTTKPVGKGTGMGLSITTKIIQRHAGEITVASQPGKTVFTVGLPVNFEAMQTAGNGAEPGGASTAPAPTAARPFSAGQHTDDELRAILTDYRTLAVVGITDRPGRPGNSVPAYLQQRGYRIIPINPNLSQVLGEKAYPDLLSVPEPVEVVLIFRHIEAVPPVVEQAIQIGARVVWMQEGIVHAGAAEAARRAGLQVVMDTCMRATHKRLFGG